VLQLDVVRQQSLRRDRNVDRQRRAARRTLPAGAITGFRTLREDASALTRAEREVVSDAIGLYQIDG